MAKHFDATVKELLALDPSSWLRLVLGREVGQASLLNADLATVVGEADQILRVEAGEPWLVHVEFQSRHDRSLPLRLQRYNILVRYRHELPVQSIAFLLRREADGPALTGVLRHALPDGRMYHEFRYDVIRTWDVPVDHVLAGGVGTLPIAPLCRGATADLPGVLRRVRHRLVEEAPGQLPELWLCTYILMGLRYAPNTVERIFTMDNILEASSTYRLIINKGMAEGLARGMAEGRAEGIAEGRAEGIAEGIAEGLRQALVRLGTKRFGPPSESATAAIGAIGDVERLQVLCERVVEVDGWEGLLGGE